MAADMASDAHQQLSMVVMMGVTGAGKSYFINTLGGKNIVEEGSDLNSCKTILFKHCSSFQYR